jgi:SAM-dependent methyltransferase
MEMTSLVQRQEIEGLLIIGAALRAGLVDAISGPGMHTAEEVASALGADLRACRVMLDALVALEVATDHGGGYSLTETGRLHLVEPAPGEPIPAELERSSLLHQLAKARGMLDLPYIVKHGEPPARDPSERDLRSFLRTMAEGDAAPIAEVVERSSAYVLPMRVSTMIDVGGAVGHVASAFAGRGVRPTLFDRPDVLPQARQYLGESVCDLYLVGGDFLSALPPGPFDLAYLGNVVHIYGPDTIAALVRRVWGSLAPGGVIVIRDFVWERSSRAPLFAVNMLQATVDGGVWREEQFRWWLAAAGFTDVTIVDLVSADNQLVMGRKRTTL